jgi:hypothetical protein
MGSSSEISNTTHYSSSSSFGKWTVQSSSLNEMGRPSKIDSDLSAARDGQID